MSKRDYLNTSNNSHKKKRILSLQVTSEQVHDTKVIPKLVDDIIIKQKKIVLSKIVPT